MTPPAQADFAGRAAAFRALHEAGCFVIPNPWDLGSLRILEGLGFPAMATTSAGLAATRGLPDGQVGRTASLEHVAELAGATALPLNADLENGYGDRPEDAAEAVRLAAAAGAVGASIEDATGRPGDPIYDRGLAVERIAAAVEAARASDLVLTARAENFLHGRPDLDDTVRRLQAFQAAGAEVLYAPGLATREQVAAVVGAVDRPVNVVMGLAGSELTLADLAGLGVRRVSLGSALSRAAFGALLRAAREILDTGTFAFAKDAVSFKDLAGYFRREG